MLLEPEVQAYYNTYFDLFMTDGWNQFMTDIQSAVDTTNILALQDAKDLHLKQGQLQVFHRLLNWEDSIKNAYESIQEESQGESNG